ncbi:DUF3800 domain-containing protein [Clostridium botulinum C]|uniref:DUF3800 domain-containing protein n=1 Tax=Clostridium botulinum TaxID=1491 RepID=UPI001E42EDB9|nr:DUF3800 domain-containing protein [Clostridium botulinum]MCD3218137.1 DUF3800 domain-containing protein [Clostridium botulinum C]
MSFEIYFDESHKLDKYTSEYSYYGVIGWNSDVREKFDVFMDENNIHQELHFAEFKLDKMYNYLKALEFALDNKIDANFYIVNTDEALNIANKIGIDGSILRNLFYIKIPERLIYGITRKLDDYKDIDIYIDKSDEYGGDCDNKVCDNKPIDEIIKIVNENKNNRYELIKENINNLLDHIQLPKTLKFQLNAQSIYRGLKYSVNKVQQINSKYSKSLQISDVFLGIISYLFQEQYLYMNPEINDIEMDKILKSKLINSTEKEFIESCYERRVNKKGEVTYAFITEGNGFKNREKLKEINKKIQLYSQKSIQKSEFIYRLLRDKTILEKIQNLNIFLWANEEEQSQVSLKRSNEKEVTRTHLSRYIAQFFQFKMEFDNENRLKILEFYRKEFLEKNSEELTERYYKDYLGYGGSLKLMVRRYLEELNINH